MLQERYDENEESDKDYLVQAFMLNGQLNAALK